MATAHFIVSTVEGSMITVCGEVIPPSATKGAQVGIYGTTCLECSEKAKHAWVTIR